MTGELDWDIWEQTRNVLEPINVGPGRCRDLARQGAGAMIHLIRVENVAIYHEEYAK